MKDIPGFEGLYAVTEDGLIWSYPKKTAVGHNGGFRMDGGRWLTQCNVTSRTEHKRVYLYKQGKTKAMLVHRAVAMTYLPNPNDLPFINHKDCNPANNRLENLEWCDAAHNAQHAFDHGLVSAPNQRGENNANATLNETLVRQIRAMHKEIGNCAEVARRLGLKPKNVNDIVRGKRWAHVTQGSGG